MKNLALLFVLSLIAATQAAAQCPSISVIGPEGVTEQGGELKFRVEGAGVSPRLQYSWTIDKGTILKGQGTPSITVATDRTVFDNLTAVVTIEGFPPSCKAVASGEALVVGIADPHPTDEWGRLKPADQRARLDNFFAELSNNPDQIGIIVLSITQKERLDSRNTRLRFVLKHASYRKFDRSRFWFILERASEERTTLWRIPPGADPPFCYNCLIIKGGDLN